ncbi:hypothetical protein M0811_14618 [Anaeramoeba ignava]|uniref:Uncharacterized protein n=1 Tax=Anaeramoeba ignava TaxID=1746090 RepID=A0A9Q0LWD6_ANAIG|nr:hypothetical protein M0811_14618 [Anaeramoeba ignava]
MINDKKKKLVPGFQEFEYACLLNQIHIYSRNFENMRIQTFREFDHSSSYLVMWIEKHTAFLIYTDQMLS